MTAVIMPSTFQSPQGGEPWLVHTYAVSNPEAQRLTASLLGRFPDVNVKTAKRGKRPLVVVECQDPQRAESLYDVIVTIDWGARLVDATRMPIALTA
ncbi:MAG: hypothetical protein ACJ71Z_03275 [Aeromicrobium sp.]